MSLALMAVGLILGGLAIGVMIRIIGAFRASHRSRTWRITRGRITHSEKVWVGARTRSPRPEIRYAYDVDGTTYEGSRIVFEYSHVYSADAVDQVLKAYPVGAGTDVYYDPNQPVESTLRPGHVGLVTGLLVGAVLLLPTSLCLGVGVIGFLDTVGMR